MRESERGVPATRRSGPMRSAPLVKVRLALAGLLALGWVGACSESSGGPNSVIAAPTEGLLVSDPVVPAAASTADRGWGGAAFRGAAGDGDSVVFVSLTPGTQPAGVIASVRTLTSNSTLTTAVEDGGFDPVPVGAHVGDTVEVIVRDGSGAVVLQTLAAVVRSRPPIVVRTDPPPRKRDVPLNSALVIVFSEPAAGSTLTSSSVQLFRGASTVAGTVSPLQGTTTAAVFEPSAPLDAKTDYRLVVTQAVRDLEGDALAADATVEFTTGTTTEGPATIVTVLPDSTALVIGSHVQLIAAARDTAAIPIVGRPFTWSNDSPAVVSVSTTGLVTGLAEGVAHARTELDGRSAVATILVSAVLTPVNSVEVVPKSATVIVGGLAQLTAVLRDAGGNMLPFRQVAWSSSDPAIASVSAGTGGTAVVFGLSSGSATITATSEGKSGTATITMGTVGPYTQISAGNGHTCALATDASAWCWGARYGQAGEFPNSGELGTGTQLASLVPAAVAGGLRFTQVSLAEGGFSCALTLGGAAYCWGANSGQLGTGDTTGPQRCGPGFSCSTVPAAVAEALTYTAISTGYNHTCALTTSGAAYCWGFASFGAMGLISPENCAAILGNSGGCAVPAAVVGGLPFTAIDAGWDHTCALTAAGAAYCWGRGDAGALGDGTLFDRSSPVPVAGGHSFVALATGGLHTCGLTSDGTAYCWGDNDFGSLGIGTTSGPQGPCRSPIDSGRGVGNCSTIPVPVAGGLRFTAISAGGYYTCALAVTGAAYCWGSNGTGDSNLAPNSPTAISGELTFAGLSASGSHACGVTWAGVAYCWGGNYAGQLGDGTTIDSNVPVKVAGQR